ncbi:MAG TPA: hypothetical protein VFU05_13615 [Cyclobacteriaceae bacterium]|nr:hypothetical protein [Cyclobacteriaceae bacterium]
MKRVFIAYAVGKDGSLSLHKHPVFTGDCAYDLGGEQKVQECQVLKVREFTGPGECLAALQDYARQHPKDEFEEIGSFVLLERFSFTTPARVNGAKSKEKAKSKTE